MTAPDDDTHAQPATASALHERLRTGDLDRLEEEIGGAAVARYEAALRTARIDASAPIIAWWSRQPHDADPIGDRDERQTQRTLRIGTRLDRALRRRGRLTAVRLRPPTERMRGVRLVRVPLRETEVGDASGGRLTGRFRRLTLRIGHFRPHFFSTMAWVCIGVAGLIASVSR